MNSTQEKTTLEKENASEKRPPIAPEIHEVIQENLEVENLAEQIEFIEWEQKFTGKMRQCIEFNSKQQQRINSQLMVLNDKLLSLLEENVKSIPTEKISELRDMIKGIEPIHIQNKIKAERR